MSIENPLWGAPRIHGELLKLGIDVGQTTVAKYMAGGRRPPSQGWNFATEPEGKRTSEIDAAMSANDRAAEFRVALSTGRDRR
jgi:hypothetical protein